MMVSPLFSRLRQIIAYNLRALQFVHTGLYKNAARNKTYNFLFDLFCCGGGGGGVFEPNSSYGPESAFPDEQSCQFSPFGCCPDGVSMSRGPDFQGCHLPSPSPSPSTPLTCDQRPYGCCPDGVKVAHGPNYDGLVTITIAKFSLSGSLIGHYDPGLQPYSPQSPLQITVRPPLWYVTGMGVSICYMTPELVWGV